MGELGQTSQRLWDRVVTLFVDPTSNLSAAFTLYGIVALVVLILLGLRRLWLALAV